MSSILNYNYRIFIASTLAIAIGAVTASAHPLVNPGFDNSSPGPGAVGGFTSVVGPPFSPGFWGAENSTIVATGGFVDPVTPLSSPYMLEMSDAGGTLTEAWQVVNVAGDLPPNSSVGLSAWFTVSSNGFGSEAGLQMWTFATGAVWPNSSGNWSTSSQIDGSGLSWEQISLAPVLIPANTEWILAEVFYVNSTLSLHGGTNGYVDDVQLQLPSVPEPASLILLVLGGLAMLRRRRA